ncbi:MAG: hypothetical protein JSC085_001005 [Candidatus Tokpelaia sp. JSC085]|nr:MAG: hypothetical protein JSC085_001005 [Candidatus Tokpelaia sp. JSC085]
MLGVSDSKKVSLVVYNGRQVAHTNLFRLFESVLDEQYFQNKIQECFGNTDFFTRLKSFLDEAAQDTPNGREKKEQVKTLMAIIDRIVRS